MNVTPFFRSPFTDLTGSMINHQSYDKCGKFEMEAMECLEAYGVERGKVKCADILSDFNECTMMTKQINRFYAMRIERHKQYLRGELKKDEHYAPAPKIDAY